VTTQPSTVPAPLARPRLRAIAGRRTVTVPSWPIGLVLVIAVFFALVAARTALDASAFELRELRAEINQESAQVAQLQIDVARASTPRRLAEAASALGLGLPEQPVLVLNSPGGKTG